MPINLANVRVLLPVRKTEQISRGRKLDCCQPKSEQEVGSLSKKRVEGLNGR